MIIFKMKQLIVHVFFFFRETSYEYLFYMLLSYLYITIWKIVQSMTLIEFLYLLLFCQNK